MPTSRDPLTPTTDREALVELFGRDRAVHPYGLADLDDAYWSRSRWWLHDQAAVGLLDLPGAGTPVVYAVSARAAAATLELLAQLATRELPDHFVATGPVGLAERLASTHRATWSGGHRKMVLAHPDQLPPPDRAAAPLGRRDEAALRALLGSDPSHGTFFTAELLDTGHYVGRWDGAALVASAGVHVVSPARGVAAIGNVMTRPDHRGQGLAGGLLATVSRRLLAEVAIVGLNVANDNLAAARLYRSLGFVDVIDYDEAELVAVG